MECTSTISFDTKCINKSAIFELAFSVFRGGSPSSWTDTEQRKEKFNQALKELDTPLDVSKFIKYLDAIDTGVTDIKKNGSIVSIEIFPWDFPEELCEYLFPILDKSGFEGISCDSDSEYGTQMLTYKNGGIVKEEDIFDM